MAKAFVKKTADERKAEAKALHAKLADSVESLAGSEQWTRWLAFAGSFHRYSFNNTMLILSQYPDATRVAGFQQWKAKGRSVRKGEKSIKIFGYSKAKVTDEDANGDEVTRMIARFPILSVFDIGQTDPIEGVEQAEDVTIAERLTGADHAGIYRTMETYWIEQGWAVERETIGGEVNGYTTTDGSRHIAVELNLEPAMAAKTMLHESGHATMHVNDEGEAAYVEHRGMAEVEAESVAHVLAGLAGLDTSAYSVGYVAGWSKGDAKIIRATAERVLAAVAKLAPVVLGEEAEADKAA